jgi:acetyltransferase-like isoleucine patch superfamily enzyme
MNLRPVYRLLVRLGILPFISHCVTISERALTDYRYDVYRSRYDLHRSFLKRRNSGIQLYGDGEIQTGPGSYIGRYSRIKAGGGTRVSIGAGCALSHGVAIYTVSWLSDQDFGDRAPDDFDALDEHSGDVVIGDNVWVGYNVFITPGTHIGDNAVIGANSVVTEDIPPDSIAAGAPARVIDFKHYVPDDRREELSTEYQAVSLET